MSEPQELEPRECPFPNCDWTWNPDDHIAPDSIAGDHEATMHYEKAHAGKVRIQVTIEYERLIGARNTDDIRHGTMERFEDKGYDVAHVRSEVLDEPSDHSVLGDE